MDLRQQLRRDRRPVQHERICRHAHRDARGGRRSHRHAVREVTMAGLSRTWIVFATMVVAAALLFVRGESNIAYAQSAPTSCSTSTSTSTSSSTSTSNSNYSTNFNAAYYEGPANAPP